MMKNTFTIPTLLAALCLLIRFSFAEQNEDKINQRDILYVGHAQDPFKVFSIDIGNQTATYVNNPFAVHPPNAYPRGLFFKGDDFNVAFERSDLDVDTFGEILQFGKSDGSFKRILVSNSEPEAPYRPRGIIWIPGNLLVVADNGYFATEEPSEIRQGYIRIYNYTSGQFLRKFSAPVEQIDPFQPRAVVYLKGKLYVTSFVGIDRPSQLRGYLSRFDPVTGFETVLANHSTASHLHRPDGIVVGPDGNMWVASFRDHTNTTDVDKILVFNENGENVNAIPLWTAGGLRKFAQALVFGPDNVLYISMTSKGEIWNYNLESKELKFVFGVNHDDMFFTDALYFLAFSKTNPSSLEYVSK